jgi:ferredoxin
MGLLVVDESKCKKDGICAAKCPAAIIKLKDGQSLPQIVPGGEPYCLICGHCVTVCPHGAFSHRQVPVEDSPPIKKGLTIDTEQAVQFLRSRRSIRFLRTNPLNRTVNLSLIDTAAIGDQRQQ